MKQLIDASPTAVMLGISKARLYELCRQMLVPHVRIGRRIKFDPDRLETWIDEGGQALPGGWRNQA